MDIRPIELDAVALGRYEDLFKACFPHAPHLTASYLRWLYVENPAGVAVGFNAHVGEQVVAHYACIPAQAMLDGRPARLLLSLNTATRPEYQGRGLLTRLASRTYEQAGGDGFDAVYGVANANSSHALQYKLGFQFVRSLDARLGIGRPYRVDWAALKAASMFRRTWTDQELRWRIGNPANPLRFSAMTPRFVELLGATSVPGIAVSSLLEPREQWPVAERRRSPAVRLFLGSLPRFGCSFRAAFDIPARLRPAPLNLMFLPLQASLRLSAEHTYLNFLDFDAY